MDQAQTHGFKTTPFVNIHKNGKNVNKGAVLANIYAEHILPMAVFEMEK